MKLIRSVIRPFKLEDVRRALESCGIHGMLVFDCRGFELKNSVHVNSFDIEFSPHLIVEAVVDDDIVSDAINAIIKSVKTGKLGDGKIFVIPVDDVVRIRTGEAGISAL